MKMVFMVLFVAFIMIIVSEVCFSDSKKRSINRLQLRYSYNQTVGFTQSSYVRFSKGFYVLEAFNFQKQMTSNQQSKRFEITAGGPLSRFAKDGDYVFGFAARLQMMSKQQFAIDPGVQFNITQLPFLRQQAKEKNIVSFLQFFPTRLHDRTQKRELLLYYQLPLYKKIYTRGYLQMIDRQKGGVLTNHWVDVIYPINKQVDLYNRISYLNKNDIRYGSRGGRIWFGIRFNFEF